MVSGQDAILIVLGLVACFAGYSLFRSMLPLWGFVLGGWIAYIFLPTIVGQAKASELLIQVIGMGVGGLIGALIAVPLYFVIIFLSGGVLGAIVGTMIGAVIDVGGVATVAQVTRLTNLSFPPIPHTATQFLLAAVFGIILGGLSINFQKFMICASSAFMGAAALISGLTGTISLMTLSSSDMNRSALIMMSWMILGFVGLLVQFRMMGEV